MVECHLAKVDVEGSNPFSRSTFPGGKPAGRDDRAPPKKHGRSLNAVLSTRRKPKGETSRDPAIDEYLTAASASRRAPLRQLRATIHAIVPEVEECISYRIPAFRYQGRVIAGFSATSRGCSYYPFSGTADAPS